MPSIHRAFIAKAAIVLLTQPWGAPAHAADQAVSRDRAALFLPAPTALDSPLGDWLRRDARRPDRGRPAANAGPSGVGVELPSMPEALANPHARAQGIGPESARAEGRGLHGPWTIRVGDTLPDQDLSMRAAVGRTGSQAGPGLRLQGGFEFGAGQAADTSSGPWSSRHR